ncbi:MAG: helix-turn-helix domain-containing protein [Candidatus Methanoperedens sp.]|nr:helix-turn-helix domain-containing protein [Candidatus Methanoperedens sp.]
MFEKLRTLGLTKYEADIYLSLMRLGSADASVIASVSGVPLGRMYSILNALHEKKIIRLQETRPRKYAAVEPETALKYLLDAQRFKLQQASMALGETAIELEKELLGIKKSPQEKQFWTAALGSQETLDIIIEQINQVNEEMCITVGYPEFSKYILTKNQEKSDVRKALLRALERGANFRMLIDMNIDYASECWDDTVKGIFKYLGKNLNCRITTFTSTLFDIIDDDRVNLKISSPVNKEELFAIVHVRDKKLVAEMKQHFEDMWKKAEPFRL